MLSGVFDTGGPTGGGGGAPLLRGLLGQAVESPLRIIGLAVGGVALAVSGLFGGLGKAEDAKAPRIEVDQRTEGKPWNVTIHGVRITDEVPKMRHRGPNARWVVVEATVEITGEETNIYVTQALQLSGVEGLIKPATGPLGDRPLEVTMLRDGTSATALHPRLPERVGFYWEQSRSAPLPKTVSVGVVNMTLRPNRLDGQVLWLDPVVRGVVEVPVRYVPNASPSASQRATSPSARPSTTARPSTAPTRTASPTPSRTR